ncbi:hypothetical protein NE236_23775 [Actinoallomurus purpureus]|uniref:hypothetical protein n=1 Tax=Actinoallomurus purpureus TaxID=478114 RepID=UPI0020934200|nr:hypothetical protein [Actinoallomurus purpureus]MCO6008002.1 hypothetical protein [Actinoallomurus purpureus]
MTRGFVIDGLRTPIGRLVLTAARELQHADAHRAVVTRCVGVGQGVSLLLERVS